MLRGKLFLLPLVLMLLATSVNAQEKLADDYPYPHVKTKEYKDFVKKKFNDQQDKFLDNKYEFPGKPKHKLELGLSAGLLMVSGDVKAKAGFGLGIHLRKALGYAFSLRGQLMLGQTKGAMWQGSQGWSVNGDGFAPSEGAAPNAALAGGDRYLQFNTEFDKVPDYVGRNDNVVFYNYQTKIREFALSGVLNLNNLRFHRRRNVVTFYGYAGLGAFIYQTKMDQLDADGNEYDYSGVTAMAYGDYDNRGDMISALNDLWDGTYESQAERHFDDYSPFDDWSFKPTAHAGFGVAFKLSKMINLALDSKVTYTNDDLLDGQRWEEWGGITRDYDTYVYSSAQLNINLGGKNSVEPLWWMSPLDYAYAELGKEPCCKDFEQPDLVDDDGDGVPNMFDEEPDSRKECPTDTRGRMLDSDGDGILDCDDCQPYTPKHLIDKINDCGRADEECCKETVIERVVSAPKPDCNDMGLPNVLFDLNRYGVKSEFAPQLQSIAGYMASNPSVRLCVVGNTDNRSSNAYNDVLSYKRAQEVINELVTNYGVSRNRLVVQYSGENNPVVGGLSDSGSKKGIDAEHALNRRVDFKCCMEGQFDMPMPNGPADAGDRKSVV